jgi:predicted dinucleotide-binding enzyme
VWQWDRPERSSREWGSGPRRSAWGRTGRRPGATGTLSNSHGPDALQGLIDDLGENATARTTEGAADFGDAVMEAISQGHVELLPTDALAGEILTSASNHYP